jgi:hypothetical protein
VSTFADRLIEKMEPWNTGPVIAGSTDLERWLKALAAMFAPVEELAKEEGSDGETGYVPAWGKLFNPELCPAKFLPYLGQYVGVQIPGGASEAEARQLVKEHAGFSRGTLTSLKAAIERVLGVGVPYTIEERTNPKTGGEEAYWMTLLVPVGEKSNALMEAVNAVIPAGILYEVIEIEGAWIEGALKWSEVEATVTWANVKPKEF